MMSANCALMVAHGLYEVNNDGIERSCRTCRTANAIMMANDAPSAADERQTGLRGRACQ